MFVHTFRRRHEDACHRFALRSPTDPEGAPRAQPSLRHLLCPRIETLQHGGRSGISLLHRRIFIIVRVSDDPPGDGQQAPDRVIDGGQHCDHCKTARTTRLGHQAGLVWSVRRHPDGHDNGINTEYITVALSFVSEDWCMERVTVCTKAFPRKHTQDEIEPWVRKVSLFLYTCWYDGGNGHVFV